MNDKKTIIIFVILACFLFGSGVATGYIIFAPRGVDVDTSRIDDIANDIEGIAERELEYQESFDDIANEAERTASGITESLGRVERSIDLSVANNRNSEQAFNSAGRVEKMATETIERLERVKRILREAGERKQRP